MKTQLASKINAALIFNPGEDHDGIPHIENVEWLRQYYPQADATKGYLVDGDESWPEEIWESTTASIGMLNSRYVKVWTREEA